MPRAVLIDLEPGTMDAVRAGPFGNLFRPGKDEPSRVNRVNNHQTTLFSVNQEQETTGPKVTTLKELSLSTLSSMSFDEKLKVATASRDSRSPTRWEEVLVLVWEHCSSRKFARNTQTE